MAGSKIFIPGNVPSSKNSRQWTGKYFVESKAVKTWYRVTKGVWVSKRIKFLSLIKDKRFPLHIEFGFVRGTKHKFDYINPAQTIQDAMVKFGWIEDDNCDILLPSFAPFNYSTTSPGVWIRVL